MTTKQPEKTKSSRRATKKGVTLADIRRQLEQTGYLPAADADAIIASVNESRRREREAARRHGSKNGT